MMYVQILICLTYFGFVASILNVSKLRATKLTRTSKHTDYLSFTWLFGIISIWSIISALGIFFYSYDSGWWGIILIYNEVLAIIIASIFTQISHKLAIKTSLPYVCLYGGSLCVFLILNELNYYFKWLGVSGNPYIAMGMFLLVHLLASWLAGHYSKDKVKNE